MRVCAASYRLLQDRCNLSGSNGGGSSSGYFDGSKKHRGEKGRDIEVNPKKTQGRPALTSSLFASLPSRKENMRLQGLMCEIVTAVPQVDGTDDTSVIQPSSQWRRTKERKEVRSGEEPRK